MVRYAMEVREDWAPWAFIKKDLKRTIASLELLGTLLCVKLWGARMKESGRGSGHLTGGTDNQGNSYAAAHGVVGDIEKGGQCLIFHGSRGKRINGQMI